MTNGSDLAEKRARLVAAAELERLRLHLAVRDIRHAILPPPDLGRRSRLRPYVVRAISYSLPILGYRKMGKLLRVAGVALAIYRVASAWRDRGSRY